MRLRRLIMLDYALVPNRGHDEVYDTAVVKEARRRKIDAEIWARPSERASRPVFLKECLTAPGFPTRSAQGLWHRIRELRSLCSGSVHGKDTAIMFQSVEAIFPVVLALALLGARSGPKLMIILRRGLDDHAAMYGSARSRLKNIFTIPAMHYLVRRKNAVFLTDSDLITRDLKERGFRTARTLPIPHMPAHTTIPHRGSVVGYLGGVRYEKGFDMLPDIIEQLLTTTNAHFLLHIYSRDRSPALDAARARLLELHHRYPKRVELLDTFLKGPQYEAAMRRCEVLCIPYRKFMYGKGTSGIVAEAIAVGAWAVVPEGTWMASLRHNYHRIIPFKTHDPKAIATAVRICLASPQDKKRTTDEIQAWYAFHAPKTYLNILEEIMEQ